MSRCRWASCSNVCSRPVLPNTVMSSEGTEHVDDLLDGRQDRLDRAAVVELPLADGLVDLTGCGDDLLLLAVGQGHEEVLLCAFEDRRENDGAKLIDTAPAGTDLPGDARPLGGRTPHRMPAEPAGVPGGTLPTRNAPLIGQPVAQPD
jgi:hypothetical protein